MSVKVGDIIRMQDKWLDLDETSFMVVFKVEPPWMACKPLLFEGEYSKAGYWLLSTETRCLWKWEKVLDADDLRA